MYSIVVLKKTGLSHDQQLAAMIIEYLQERGARWNGLRGFFRTLHQDVKPTAYDTAIDLQAQLEARGQEAAAVAESVDSPA